MRIDEHSVVTLNFVVKDDRGQVLDDLHARTPLKVTARGEGPPGLAQGLIGLEAGDSSTMIVPPERAYGERDPGLVERVRRSELPHEELEVGCRYRRMTPDGKSEAYTVIGFLEDWVYLDRNHPWAGEVIRYEVHILEVAPADPRGRGTGKR